MMRWLIWAVLLISTAGTSTIASRARNTTSYWYHGLAALGSHGTFFLAQIIGVDLLVEVIQTRSILLGIKGFIVYAGASTAGSVLSHWIAMNYFEKGMGDNDRPDHKHHSKERRD